MNTVTAIRDLGHVGQPGVTNPHFMECDDGKEYVVKFPHPQWTRDLVNEGVGTQLAIHLGLPTPEGRLVTVSQDLIDVSPSLQKRGLQPGVYFGSTRIDGAFNLTGGLAGRLQPEELANRPDAAGLIHFDNWTLNIDRQNAGNLLVQPIQVNNEIRYRLIMIDQGYILTGPSWTRAQLDSRHAVNPLVAQFPFVNACVQALAEFTTFHDRAAATTPAQIEAICKNLPTAWGLTTEDITSIKAFLSARAPALKPLLSPIPNPTFPNLR